MLLHLKNVGIRNDQMQLVMLLTKEIYILRYIFRFLIL